MASSATTTTGLHEKLLVDYPTTSKRAGSISNQLIEEADEQEERRSSELKIRTDVGKFEMLRVMLSVGIKSFGGPMTQVEHMRVVFVEEIEWMSEEVFQDILEICCGIPGSVVTQMAISIGSLTTSSWTGGVFSFIGYSLPSAILMGIFGCLYRLLELESIEVPCYGKLALHGFASGCVAVVVQAAWKFSIQMRISWKNIWIIIVSLLLYVIYESPIFMIALMIVGGFAMQMIEETDYQRQSIFQDGSIIPTEIPFEEPRLSKLISTHRGMFGKTSLYLYIVILGALLFLRISTKDFVVEQAISFFYVGSLLMGGGHVGVPLLLSEFTNFHIITKNIFFNGFSVNNMLPGPIMNLAVYVGGFSDGFRGAIIGYVFLFLPTFLFIWGVLPIWYRNKKDPHIMNFIRGAGIVSIGFVFATAFKLWQNAGQEDMVTSTFLVIIAFILLNIYDMPAPFVVMIGGLLTVVRYMSLHDYRGVEETEQC